MSFFIGCKIIKNNDILLVNLRKKTQKSMLFTIKIVQIVKNMYNFTSKRVLYSICFRLWVRGYGETS